MLSQQLRLGKTQGEPLARHTVEKHQGIANQNDASRYWTGRSHGKRAETAQAAQWGGRLYAGRQCWKRGEKGGNTRVVGGRELRSVPEESDLDLSRPGGRDVGLDASLPPDFHIRAPGGDCEVLAGTPTLLFSGGLAL